MADPAPPPEPDATAAPPLRVDIAGTSVPPVAFAAGHLRATGMWGEPASRSEALRTLRAAVELGAELVEVPVPFGPWADLVREAALHAVTVAARLTGPVRHFDDIARRLGRHSPVALVLAPPDLLDGVRAWDGPAVGVVAGPDDTDPDAWGPLAAVRGPYPPAARVVEWCADRRVPYLAPDPAVLAVPGLAAGPGRPPLAVALVGGRTPAEAGRGFRAAGAAAAAARVTPPGATPG